MLLDSRSMFSFLLNTSYCRLVGITGERVKMRMSDANVQSMVAAKCFTENADRINHMDYTADGSLLITSSFDDSITVYDCNSGTKSRQVNSKKYGVNLIHFAHERKDAIHSSTKVDSKRSSGGVWLGEAVGWGRIGNEETTFQIPSAT